MNPRYISIKNAKWKLPDHAEYADSIMNLMNQGNEIISAFHPDFCFTVEKIDLTFFLLKEKKLYVYCTIFKPGIYDFTYFITHYPINWSIHKVKVRKKYIKNRIIK